jgi:predicted ribosome quality control (RQC) complex YloA/Tae2 family protein
MPGSSDQCRNRKPMARAKSSPHESSFRLIEYRLPGGWKVFVGRTDADNDYLSLRLARPNDWWFHVRGMPGSNVVLQAVPGGDPDRQTLKRAAAIAAYHSKAREAGVVAVSYTRARYVTKPRGAPVGTVQIRKEVVLKVRPALGEAVIAQPSDSPAESGRIL